MKDKPSFSSRLKLNLDSFDSSCSLANIMIKQSCSYFEWIQWGERERRRKKTNGKPTENKLQHWQCIAQYTNYSIGQCTLCAQCARIVPAAWPRSCIIQDPHQHVLHNGIKCTRNGTDELRINQYNEVLSSVAIELLAGRHTQLHRCESHRKKNDNVQNVEIGAGGKIKPGNLNQN